MAVRKGREEGGVWLDKPPKLRKPHVSTTPGDRVGDVYVSALPFGADVAERARNQLARLSFVKSAVVVAPTQHHEAEVHVVTMAESADKVVDRLKRFR